MMDNLGQLIKKGFSLPRWQGGLEDLALFSLRIALKAYFSSARAMKGSLHVFNDPADLEHWAVNHPSSYCESYAETVVHFQHFAELVCKELLRKEHELLATDASDRPAILHALLKETEISPQELEKSKSIEFGEALKRLCTLVNDGCMSSNPCRIICEQRSLLERLNKLRNRIWHRGTFILYYPALDEFVGRFFLPFVLQIMSSPEYSNRSSVWKYKPLACGMDPIDEIVNHFRSEQYDVRQIAFLKELGRAAYSNPFNQSQWHSHFDGMTKRRAIRFAGAETSHIHSTYCTSCPVCGTESLVVYKEFDIVDEDSGAGCEYVDEVKCLCCSFQAHPQFGTPADHGFPIQNWD